MPPKQPKKIPKAEMPEYTESQNIIMRIEKILNKNGLEIKASKMMNKRVYYFRGKDLFDAILNCSQQIIKLTSDSSIKVEKLETKQQINDFAQILIDQQMMIKLTRMPKAKKFKWPRELVPAKERKFVDKEFYMWRYEEPESHLLYIALGIIGVVIICCLFPVWPMSLKFWVFHSLFYFCIAILGFVVVRLVIFIVLWIFGFEFWIYPNLFNEDLGFFDSFKPLLRFDRSDDNWSMFAFRIVVALIIIYLGYFVYHRPQLFTEGFDGVGEFADWSFNALAGPNNDAQNKMQEQKKVLQHLLEDEIETANPKNALNGNIKDDSDRNENSPDKDNPLSTEEDYDPNDDL